MYDHFPFHMAATEHAIQLISTPAGSLTPPAVPPSRFVKQGFYLVCRDCGYTIDYCGCGPRVSAASAAQDGAAAASLDKRIQECKGR